MTQRIALPTVVASAIIAVACLSALFARDVVPSNWKSLERSYAQASVELAQARLAMAQSENAAAAGSVSKELMDVLKAGLLRAQDQMRQFESSENASPLGPQIIEAEGALQAMQVNHAESMKANQIQAGAVSDVALRREQAEIELAKARVAALKSLAQQPADVQLAWQIRFLQDDIGALRARPIRED